ncbi:alginate lyase domain-containing protein, partial [Zychaea mexicana]|uniref:alginate lyase domain-containing protein n=1 Tax=Zychaea mexicana TaxID=64656 RepID=UPI0022FEA02F
VVVDPAALRENKQHMHDFDRGLQHALWFLKKKADRYASNDTVFSVVHKSIAVPGAGDKHDYMSLARYYWPNESQPHGMPYIRHDGKVNPEIHKVPDYTQFRNLVKHVQFLALGYHYFDNETYAERATQRIHDWFINPETRMNPHLQYASLVRGYNTGRAKGIIDFHVLPDLLDSVAILQYSQAWQEYKGTTNAHIRYWFAQYIEWLTESPNGIYEMESHNNHGTYYDIQRAAIYRFLDKADLARQVVVNASAARVAQQILTSGEQYLETARPTSWLYSIFNLKALFRLAHISDQLGVDLYGYTTVDNKSIKAALDFVLPYALNESSWSF